MLLPKSDTNTFWAKRLEATSTIKVQTETRAHGRRGHLCLRVEQLKNFLCHDSPRSFQHDPAGRTTHESHRDRVASHTRHNFQPAVFVFLRDDSSAASRGCAHE